MVTGQLISNQIMPGSDHPIYKINFYFEGMVYLAPIMGQLTYVITRFIEVCFSTIKAYLNCYELCLPTYYFSSVVCLFVTILCLLYIFWTPGGIFK